MTAGRRYLAFAALATAVAAAVAGAGVLLTRLVAGPGADAAVVAGCAVSLAASLIGGLPLVIGRQDRSMAVAALAATGLRLGVVLVLTLVLAVASGLARKPFLFGTAVSYLALLAVDTRFALVAASSPPAAPHDTEDEG
jgi:hypothetical protein